MPAKRKKRFQDILIIYSIVVGSILLVTSLNKNNFSLAKDKCSDISNVEDKAECYEKAEEETKRKLEDTLNKINTTLSDISKLSTQLNVTQSELNQVQNNINEIKSQLEEINENLQDTNEKLKDKINFRNNILREYSKKNTLTDIQMLFRNTSNLTGFQFSTFVYAYNKATNEEVLNTISALNSEIRGFENDKKDAENIKEELEKAQNSLIALTKDLANKKNQAEDQAEELEEKKTAYEEELEELQAKIISIKSGDGNGTVGDYASPSAKTPEPPFKPAFAAFSYGAYTHYKGMSQYGAKGRAEDGKDYEDIIEFYYNEDVKEKDIPDKICVEGYGNMDFQKYLYGLGEMPSDWPMDALKAQAVAARSYAYRYAKQGKCICTTQSCQVFVKSKSDNPPSRWEEAVDETKDEIIDGDIVAYYSSTTGGYIDNIGWDTDGKWPGDSYEKKGGSPWFYKAWYTKSYSDGSTCNHSHPWLSEKEMADIINSYVVYTKGSSKDKSHISPTTTSCWGGDPYSLDKMAEKADEYGTKYSSVSSVKTVVGNNGITQKVIFSTNQGTVELDGPTFKTVFNLRAPGYVAIRSRLFDLERRN